MAKSPKKKLSPFTQTNISKNEIKQLSKLVSIAYERELSHELESLEKQFDTWRNGEIDAFELNEIIHRHHDGASRSLFKKYTEGGDVVMKIAHAIIGSILNEGDFPSKSLYLKIRPVIDLLNKF